MSVYKSFRKESTMEFLKTSQQLCVYTIKQLKKFPKSYRFNLLNDIHRLGIEIYECELRGNSIYMHKNMTEKDYLQRREYFVRAKSAIFAMSGLLTITFDLVLQGNNFLGDSKHASKVFQEWARLLNRSYYLIKGVIESDTKRWKGYKTSKKKKPETEEVIEDDGKIIDEDSFVVPDSNDNDFEQAACVQVEASES